MTSALILARSRKMGRMILKRVLQDKDEDAHHGEDGERDDDAAMQEIDEGQDGGEQAADEFDQAGADEVADAFHVGHDAGDQGAGAVFVVVGDGEQADVPLHLAAHLGDEALAGFGEQLGERERRDGLDDHGAEDERDDAGQQLGVGMMGESTVSRRGLEV